ncbi:hypothetical protein SPHINGO8AM_60093 [Sphingomonas sp. 8AM]|nr:hypothetical protein SPHINGO8AM_60093 [Sphingomonas sp. 8AM]
MMSTPRSFGRTLVAYMLGKIDVPGRFYQQSVLEFQSGLDQGVVRSSGGSERGKRHHWPLPL